MNPAPLIEKQDVTAVAAQMRTQWIGRGTRVAELEIVMAVWVQAYYAVVFGSGTMALWTALQLLPGTTIHLPARICEAVRVAAAMAGKRLSTRSRHRVSIYPRRGGTIEDFARHLPRHREACLEGRFGVFSFGALKDVTGGIGGCLVSREPFPAWVRGLQRLSPLSDINAELILSQLARYTGHHTQRIVANGKLWTPPA